MNAAEQMSNPNHCTTMTEVNRVVDLIGEYYGYWTAGLEEGWAVATMNEIGATIAKLTAMLPEWCR